MYQITKKPKTMNWKEKNKNYVDDSVSLISAILIIVISLLIGCLAGNI
jgi:uncharacterized membrane protein YkgB